MKRMFCLALAFFLTGCAPGSEEMEEALALRSAILGANSVRFSAEITADYIDHAEQFTLECATDSAGALSFRVEEPEEIQDITGTVTGEQGTLTFDDTILAFPLMADDNLSPVSGPWVMMKALRSGYIQSCAKDGKMLHITASDSYSGDALTVEIWVEENQVVSAEIAWQGRRQMTLRIEDFSIV